MAQRRPGGGLCPALPVPRVRLPAGDKQRLGRDAEVRHLVPDPIGFAPWPVLLDPGEPCDICQRTSPGLFAGLFVTPRNKDDMGDGVPTDQLSHNHCDCTDRHCNSHIVLPFVPSPITSPSAAEAAQRLRRDEGVSRRVAAASRRSERSARRAGPGEARLVISQDGHIDFVLFLFFIPFVNRHSLRQPVDGCGGARSRTLQVRRCCSISCLVRHVSRKVFSFCMHVNRFFFSFLAFTRSCCHPRHAMACSFGTLSRPVVRAVTAPKHEPGSLPSYRVVSYDSGLEVWALLVRSSHCQRARSELCAVVPFWRAAWIRWSSVVISEAAAKHCFQLCSTEQPSQIQNQSIFHATQRTGLTDNTSDSTAREIISARISFPSCATIVPLLDWLHARVADDFCSPEDPGALGDDFSYFGATQQQWCACVRRMLRC